MRLPNLLDSRRGRALLFAVLYLSEGAPIGFVWWALPTLLRQHGVGVAEITSLTAVLALPWALKFLWAPLVDALRGPRWGLRAWIAAAQLAMGASLLPLLGLDLARSFDFVFVLLVAHAFAAATQDVAIDALAIESVPEAERGAINGWMQAGMLAGRALVGGVGLAIVHVAGEDGLLLLLIASIWASLVLLAFARPPSPPQVGGFARMRELGEHLREALRTPLTWYGFAFAALGGAGFEAAGAVAGPLLVDRGTPTETIAVFFSAVSVPCMIVGALVGGRAADAWGKARATGRFLALIFVAVCALATVDALAGAAVWPRLAGLAGIYLALGLFTASSYALFMDLTDARIAATQFSAFMAMTNVCESWSAYLVGQTVPLLGYPLALAAMALLSLGALPLLPRLARSGTVAEA